MSLPENANNLEHIGTIKNGRPMGEEGPVSIVNGVVLSKRTGRRSVTAPIRMGMFDTNSDILAKRAATVPDGTPVLRTRRQ